MALSQKHRTALFAKLAPLVGEEETEAVLAEFPSNDLEVPATKDFVRAELHHQIGLLRTELHHEIGALRSELHREIGSLRADIGALQRSLDQMEVRMGERMRAQMIWLTGLVVAAAGLLRALGG